MFHSCRLRASSLQVITIDSTTIDWQEVATHLEGRTNKDCRKRWVYALRIVVTKGPWGQDEDQRLEAGVELHGCRWKSYIVMYQQPILTLVLGGTKYQRSWAHGKQIVRL